MKVLWLCSWFPNKLDGFGGDFIERHAKSLSLHHPVDVIHIVQNHELSKNVPANAYVTEHVGLRVMIHVVSAVRLGFPALNKLVFNINYFLCLRRTIKKYINEHGKPDIVHVHVPVKIGAGALYLKKKFNIPFVVTEHNSAYFSHIPGNYHHLNLYYQWIARKTFNQAVAVSSVSNWLLKRLDELFNINKARLIRNAVDDQLFFYTPVNNLKKRFIHVSMMEPLKNVRGILSAFIELNKNFSLWELVLVGPFVEEYKQIVKEGRVEDKVIFTGLISYPEVAAQMRTADVLIHFSRYENLPCVINEALCCGLAVISSDVGGIKEIITADNGLMVHSEDVTGLNNAILQYLKHDGAYNRERISAQALTLFNYKNIGLELFAWYKEILNNKNVNVQ